MEERFLFQQRSERTWLRHAYFAGDAADGRCRLDVDDSLLHLCELIADGVEDGYVVIAVLITVPSPVDMHQTLCVVSVENEGMALALLCESTVYDRQIAAELVVDDVHPSLLGIVLTLQILHVGQSVIALQTSGKSFVERAATALCG